MLIFFMDTLRQQTICHSHMTILSEPLSSTACPRLSAEEWVSISEQEQYRAELGITESPGLEEISRHQRVQPSC